MSSTSNQLSHAKSELSLEKNSLESPADWVTVLANKVPVEMFDQIFDEILEEEVESRGWDLPWSEWISEMGMLKYPYQFINGLLGTNKATRTAVLRICLQRFEWRFQYFRDFEVFLERSETFAPGGTGLIRELELRSDVWGGAWQILSITGKLYWENCVPDLRSLRVIFEQMRVGHRSHKYADENPVGKDFWPAVKAMSRLSVKKMQVWGLRDDDLAKRIEDQAEFQADCEIPSWLFVEEGKSPTEREDGPKAKYLEWARASGLQPPQEEEKSDPWTGPKSAW